jgi:cytochrome P450
VHGPRPIPDVAPTALGPDDDVEYDPFSYELDRDPYPVYRWMRDFAPAYHNERLDFWAFTRFRDNLDAFLDPATYSSSWGTSLEFMDGPKDGSGLMIYMDAPRHTRYRKLVSGAFTLGRVRALEPLIRELAVRHLDALVGRPRFDVVREFTARLPMDVISTLLGIPEADRGEVQRKSNLMLHREPGDPNPTPEAVRSALELIPYWTEQIEERRRQPKDDLMSALVQVEVADDGGVPQRLSDEEIRSFLILLATAGNETVTKLLATAFLELARHPDQRRALVAEPRWIANAVEETLRFDPPSQYQGRITTREVEVHGVRIPKHGRVLLLNGATGRDERRFADPDRFDVRRIVDLHLGFGYGRHFCLGASLARLESRIGIEEFLRRWPDYEAPAGGVERMHSSNVRGLSGLVIEPAPNRTRSHPKG